MQLKRYMQALAIYFGVLFAFSIVFSILRLCGAWTLPWSLILLPVWAGASLLFAVVGFLLLVALAIIALGAPRD